MTSLKNIIWFYFLFCCAFILSEVPIEKRVYHLEGYVEGGKKKYNSGNLYLLKRKDTDGNIILDFVTCFHLVQKITSFNITSSEGYTISINNIKSEISYVKEKDICFIRLTIPKGNKSLFIEASKGISNERCKIKGNGEKQRLRFPCYVIGFTNMGLIPWRIAVNDAQIVLFESVNNVGILRKKMLFGRVLELPKNELQKGMSGSIIVRMYENNKYETRGMLFCKKIDGWCLGVTMNDIETAYKKAKFKKFEGSIKEYFLNDEFVSFVINHRFNRLSAAVISYPKRNQNYFLIKVYGVSSEREIDITRSVKIMYKSKRGFKEYPKQPLIRNGVMKIYRHYLKRKRIHISYDGEIYSLTIF